LVETYNFKYKDGPRSWGGYSSYARINERFLFPVPSKISPTIVASLLFSGVAVFSPLTRNGVGVGGLGHYAIMFANALGAEVANLSHSAKKKHDAIQMAAKHFVDTSQEDWTISKRNLDLIICISFAKDMSLKEYIGLLDIEGTFVCWNPGVKPPAFAAHFDDRH
jgi:alcohol dehydrogenase (NADP+)